MTPIDQSPLPRSTREQLADSTKRLTTTMVVVTVVCAVLALMSIAYLGRAHTLQRLNQTLTTTVFEQRQHYHSILSTVDDAPPTSQLAALRDSLRLNLANQNALALFGIQTVAVKDIYSEPPYRLRRELERFVKRIEVGTSARAANTTAITRGFDALASRARSVNAANHRTITRLTLILLPLLLVTTLLVSIMLLRRSASQLVKVQDKLADDHDNLAWQLEHDSVTELSNAQHANGLLDDILERIAGDGRRHAAYLVRIRRHNALYEALGSERLDQILQTVADRLRILFPDALCLARVANSDFIVVPDEPTTVESAQQTALKIIHAVERTVKLEHQAVYPVANVGMTLIPDDGRTVALVRSNCEIALRNAVHNGLSSAMLFCETMRTPVTQSRQRVKQIREGLDNGEFSVFFQPKFFLKNGRYCGCEALVRWHHPQEGLLSPSSFITIAENAGLMHEITHAVFNAVDHHSAAWHAVGLNPGFVAINIPERILSTEAMVKQVRLHSDRLRQRSVGLHIEVAEDVSVTQEQGKLDDISKRLSELNVTYVWDDFGAGVSSLTHLHNSPFDVVSIERELVSNVLVDGHADLALESLLNLVHALGKQSAVKGIESQEHLAYLRSLGCDIGQGTLLSPPLPPEAMRQFLGNHVWSFEDKGPDDIREFDELISAD